jgi:hypothetical protein
MEERQARRGERIDHRALFENAFDEVRQFVGRAAEAGHAEFGDFFRKGLVEGSDAAV